jgi:hypothetical protein
MGLDEQMRLSKLRLQTNPKKIIAVPIRPLFSVREKSNAVLLSTFLTEKATSIA